MDNIEKRREEISLKFFEMGLSLTKEGESLSDYQITQAGNLLVFLAGVILDEEDTFEFSEICAFFSAKKITENFESQNENENISFEDMMKKMFGSNDEDKEE